MLECPECGKWFEEDEYGLNCPYCGYSPRKMKKVNMKKLVFEEVDENELFADYTAACSGSRSDCCTRVCTRECDDRKYATEDEWGKFLNVEGGVIQY